MRARPSPPADGLMSGGLPVLGSDNRREQRVKVQWPARVQMPDGRVVELRVRGGRVPPVQG